MREHREHRERGQARETERKRETERERARASTVSVSIHTRNPSIPDEQQFHLQYTVFHLPESRTAAKSALCNHKSVVVSERV